MKAPATSSVDTQDESMNINNNNSNPTLPKPIKKRKLSKTQSQVYAKTTNFSESEILRLHRKFQVRIRTYCTILFFAIHMNWVSNSFLFKKHHSF